MFRKILRGATIAAATATVVVSGAQADTGVGSGAASATASARLDFRVSVPTFLLFRVGSPGAGNIDLVEFDLTGSVVGTPVAAVAPTGDVAVQIITSEDNVDIASSTTGPLASGLDTISFTEITAISLGGIIAPPALADGAGPAPTAVNTAAVKNVSDTWQFRFENTAAFAAGVYTGRATYTASAP